MKLLQDAYVYSEICMISLMPYNNEKFQEETCLSIVGIEGLEAQMSSCPVNWASD